MPTPGTVSQPPPIHANNKHIKPKVYDVFRIVHRLLTVA